MIANARQVAGPTTDMIGNLLVRPEHREIFARRHEIEERMRAVSKLKSAVLKAVRDHDPLYAFLATAEFDANASNFYSDLKFALPYALCPAHPDDLTVRQGCRWCKGRGWLTERRYKLCVESRAAAQAMPDTGPPLPSDAIELLLDEPADDTERSIARDTESTRDEGSNRDLLSISSPVPDTASLCINTTQDPLYISGSTGPLYITPEIESLVAATLPRGPARREWHQRIFDLARGLKFGLAVAGPEHPTARSALRRWYEAATAATGRIQSLAAVDHDFRSAWDRACIPKDADLLTRAAAAALARHSDPLSRMTELCAALAAARPDRRFFLSNHEAAKRLKLAAPMTAWRLLRRLEDEGVIVCEERGERGKPGSKATRFRYVGRQAEADR